MKKILIAGGILFASLILLAVTNPSEKGFVDWVTQEWVRQEYKSNETVQRINKKNSNYKLFYSNYFVFSTVKIKFTDRDSRAFGILGNWFFIE